MTYKEESYVLDSLKDINERIRDMPDLKLLAKEVHQNNIMLNAIIRYLANEARNADAENTHDFGRNVLANLISNLFEGNVGNFIRNGNNK